MDEQMLENTVIEEDHEKEKIKQNDILHMLME